MMQSLSTHYHCFYSKLVRLEVTVNLFLFLLTCLPSFYSKLVRLEDLFRNHHNLNLQGFYSKLVRLEV